jgi:hypothetical protein
VAGAVLSFSVTALDDSNGVVSSYAGTLRFSSTDPHAQLPAPLALVNGGGSFGVTLSTPGNQTVTATDVTKISITGTSNPVAITSPQPLAITSGAPPDGTVGVGYGPSNGGFTFAASGGVAPYTWSWVAAGSSSLPPGLGLANGEISGTPTAAGTYSLVVSLKDSGSPPSSATPTYTIKISNPAAPVVNTTPALPAGVVNLAYPGYTFAASSGLAPYSWSENGPLPGGMTFTAGGSLAGTPTAAGAFPITVTVRDSLNQESAPQNFAILILAQATGFTDTGSMSTARASHSATLLSDGKVLVVGGRNANSKALATAEVYSPDAKTFSATAGSMMVERTQHTATLLCDLMAKTCGNPKVLVAGGYDANGNVLTEAEIYDPSTGMFTATGSMLTARKGHTATLLKDGKVLITGGADSGGFPLATAELYDPSGGSFTATAQPMSGERSYHTAARLDDGTVLIAGGSRNLSRGELFDPSTNEFTQTANGGIGTSWLTVTLLVDGRALVAGGDATCSNPFVCGEAPLTESATSLYSPLTESFSGGPHMSVPRAAHTATLLGDARVLVAGGSRETLLRYPLSELVPEANAELYDPLSGVFAQVPNMTKARAWHTATLLNDGSVLLIGGVSANNGVEASAEIYK